MADLAEPSGSESPVLPVPVIRPGDYIRSTIGGFCHGRVIRGGEISLGTGRRTRTIPVWEVERGYDGWIQHIPKDSAEIFGNYSISQMEWLGWPVVGASVQVEGRGWGQIVEIDSLWEIAEGAFTLQMEDGTRTVAVYTGTVWQCDGSVTVHIKPREKVSGEQES